MKKKKKKKKKKDYVYIQLMCSKQMVSDFSIFYYCPTFTGTHFGWCNILPFFNLPPKVIVNKKQKNKNKTKTNKNQKTKTKTKQKKKKPHHSI